MKHLLAATLCVGMGFGVVGCNIIQRTPDTPSADNGMDKLDKTVFAKREPQAADLVGYMNETARRVQGIHCNRVAIDVQQGDQPPLGIDGMLACQKPRQFRLKGKLAGSDVVDLGSNPDEFWYWVGKADPHVFHCAYKDMSTGQVQLPFPFNPDLIVYALNIGEYDPKAHYDVRRTKDTIELIEPTKSLQGQDIWKVTVFNRGEASGSRPRVLAYVLMDKQGKSICSANILETKVNKETGAVLPERVKIVFYGKTPKDNAEMKMQFGEIQPKIFDADRSASLFSRSDLGNLQGYDLARNAPDRPIGMGQSGVRQIGGVDR
jgi:hypothetical protein